MSNLTVEYEVTRSSFVTDTTQWSPGGQKSREVILRKCSDSAEYTPLLCKRRITFGEFLSILLQKEGVLFTTFFLHKDYFGRLLSKIGLRGPLCLVFGDHQGILSLTRAGSLAVRRDFLTIWHPDDITNIFHFDTLSEKSHSDILTYWHIDILTYWHIDILT